MDYRKMLSDLPAISERFNLDVRDRKTILLVAECSVEYWGRSRSLVGKGDRVILFKQDSTLIIHSPCGFKPLNWMSAPTDTNASVEKDMLIINSQQTKKPFEEMKISISKIIGYESFDSLTDKKAIEVTHTEADMQKYLAANPKLVHPDFRLKATEYKSPLGFFDLYGKIGVKYCVVELKAERAGLPAALQIKRYRDWLTTELKQDVIAILMAPAITPNSQNILKKEKIEFKKFNIKKVKLPNQNKKTTTLEKWCGN
ncbi:MAG: endonuclease NucS domain-containing protein [Candidatus Altiarchaeota archaeon]